MSDILLGILNVALWIFVIAIGLFGAYMALAFTLLVCLGIYAALGNIVHELYIRRKMRLAGRFIPWKKAIGLIENPPGTLIVESPTVGWNITRTWWTPDNVLAQAPVLPLDTPESEPMDLARHPFIEWCHKNYTDTETGSARLIAVYNGKRTAEKLAKRVPELERIDLWTAVLFLKEKDLAYDENSDVE